MIRLSIPRSVYTVEPCRLFGFPYQRGKSKSHPQRAQSRRIEFPLCGSCSSTTSRQAVEPHRQIGGAVSEFLSGLPALNSGSASSSGIGRNNASASFSSSQSIGPYVTTSAEASSLACSHSLAGESRSPEASHSTINLAGILLISPPADFSGCSKALPIFLKLPLSGSATELREL